MQLMAPKPLYSNTVDIDEHVRKLRTSNEKWLPKFFDSCFVGKVPGRAALASAHRLRAEDGSFLSVIGTGLSMAVLFWCEAFARYIKEFQSLEGERGELERTTYFNEIAHVFERWREASNVIELIVAHRVIDIKNSGTDPFSMAPAILSDRFIISHELGHHIMNDTGIDYETGHEIERFLHIFRNDSLPSLLTGGATHEYSADCMAIHLLVGEPSLYKVKPSEFIVPSHGVLATLSTIACLSENPYADGDEDYPTPNARFDVMMSFLETIAMNWVLEHKEEGGFSSFKTMRKDVMDFHDLINRARLDRGDFIYPGA